MADLHRDYIAADSADVDGDIPASVIDGAYGDRELFETPLDQAYSDWLWLTNGGDMTRKGNLTEDQIADLLRAE